MLKALDRYWQTLRHLRPVQIYGRLWFRMWRPRLDVRPAPALRAATGAWQLPIPRESSMVGPGEFILLGQPGKLSEVGWDGPARGKLWRYNQHYFDDLNSRESASRVDWHRALLTDWVEKNASAGGNGWEPYPVSLRLVNWIKWAQAGNAIPAVGEQSLAVQARWLVRRLEVHLLGNHLFSNAKALVFAGLFFEGEDAGRWLAKGLGILDRELQEQVLPDGGNFERSPMYHAIFLEDVLDLINAAGAWPGQVPSHTQARWRATAGTMIGWLDGLVHPDGQIAFFNDAAVGVAPELSALRDYAARLGVQVPPPEVRQGPHLQSWPESGYIRISSPRAVALLDVAPVGPDYLPGHAHADTLSFELSVAGMRLIVNGGTSQYGVGLQRTRERSTAAHSTVEVAGENSSEVWGGFRVARRARPFDLQSGGDASTAWAACSHDGYRRLPGQPVHRRTWSMDAQGLTVTDAVTHKAGAEPLPALARFILHPSAQVAPGDATRWHAILPGGQSIELKPEHGTARLEPAQYAPEFGKVLATQCLVVQLVDGRAVTRIAWA